MLFSVLIPAYKKRFLEECVASVLRQSLPDFEVIILDDKSPENLQSVIDSFQDDRIRVFRNEKNVGAVNLVDNWNKCLNLAQGEYVLCIGDDDVLMPNCLEEYAKAIKNHPDSLIIHCRSHIIDERSKTMGLTPTLPEYETVLENMWQRIHYHREQFVGDFLYKREALLNNGGFFNLPLAWGSDDITSYIAMKDKGVYHVNEPIFCYRKTGLTISSNGNAEYKLKAIEGEERWITVFLADFVARSAAEEKRLIDLRKEMPVYFNAKRKHTILYYGLLGDGPILPQLIRLKKSGALSSCSFMNVISSMIIAYKKKLIPKKK